MARSPISVSVTRNEFPRILRGLPAANSRAVGKTCFAFVAGWKARAHVLTGAYRNSITTDYRTGAQESHVFTNLDYPYFEETGTRFRPGHPAFRPTFAEQAPLHPQRVAAEIRGLAR